MQVVHRRLALLLAVLSLSSWAESGLRAPDASDSPIWPRWQARIEISGQPVQSGSMQGAALASARMLGDYRLASTKFRQSGLSGSLRATGGLLLGSRSTALIGVAPATRQQLTISRLPTLWAPQLTADRSGDSVGGIPYVGLGYSGLSDSGGWGFTADFGLMALSSGNGLRTTRALSGMQSLEDLLRDFRLTPLLQLGISYEF